MNAGCLNSRNIRLIIPNVVYPMASHVHPNSDQICHCFICCPKSISNATTELLNDDANEEKVILSLSSCSYFWNLRYMPAENANCLVSMALYLKKSSICASHHLASHCTIIRSQVTSADSFSANTAILWNDQFIRYPKDFIAKRVAKLFSGPRYS